MVSEPRNRVDDSEEYHSYCVQMYSKLNIMFLPNYRTFVLVLRITRVRATMYTMYQAVYQVRYVVGMLGAGKRQRLS